MSLQPITDHQRRDELHAAHERARAEAVQLRREAIDDFWRGANDLLGHAALAGLRSAARLGARLRRRAAGGAAPVACAGPARGAAPSGLA